MKLFKNLPIGTKLLIVLLLVSILPLLAVTYGFYRSAKIKLTEQTIRTLEVQAKNTSVSIHNLINFKFKHINGFVRMPQLIRILMAPREEQPHIFSRATSFFRARLRIDPDFLAMLLLDREGHVVLSTDARTDTNYATRPFFSEAMKGRNCVSTPCVDGGMPCIYFSVPVHDGDKILGVVVFQTRAEELWELIECENERVGLGNAVILSNSDGVRIAHSSRRDLIFKSWAPLKPERREQVLREKRYGSDMKEIASTDIPEVMDAVTTVSHQKYFTHRLVIGQGTYHSVIRAMDNGWRIICTIPEATFLEPVKSQRTYVLSMAGIIVCLVAGAAIAIGRLGTKRINAFTSISKEIAKGDFTKEVPFTNGDEIGQLGRTFNIMIASVKRKIEQLKYLNDVAIEVHSHIEIGRLLQDIANIAKRLVNAEMSALLLLDEIGEEIKHFKVSMPNSLEAVYIKDTLVGEWLGGMEPPKSVSGKAMVRSCGILGTVLTKGLSIRLDNETYDKYLVNLPVNHPPVHTLLGVPVKMNYKVIGGLFLANKVNNERFTLEDEEILFNLAYQAAVAIKNAKLFKEVWQLAITDGLTSLLNHKEFHRRLDEYIEGSKRYQYNVSLLMIDIDHFKHFNDTYGHQVGDQVLKTVGDIIKEHVRVVDVCARYGGEEFAVLLRESDMPGVVAIAERIRSTIYAYPFKHDGIRSQLSVSIGIASFPQDAASAEDLIRKADEALYTAKRAGRNNVCCYESCSSSTLPPAPPNPEPKEIKNQR
ncbi:MAG: diguanylate cyclase [Candidatus Brocadia sp.]